ncbi:MAG TPA: hypothetical protein VN457_04995, partial [Chlamydiales bacterium]|nr:hypothetical protein [Chlamydiales bacterium]
MRLIWTTQDRDGLKKLIHLLQQKNISYLEEEVHDPHWDSEHYGIARFHLWIHDEDKVKEAKEMLQQFLENPHLQIPLEPEIKKTAKQPLQQFLKKQEQHTTVIPPSI